MKKTLSMLLALVLTFGLAVSASAMEGNAKITGMTQSLAHGYSDNGGDADLGDVYPQDGRVEYINLYDTMFTWDSGDLTDATPTRLTQAQIREARLEVHSTRRNPKVIDSITLNQRESRIEVKFNQEYVGAKEIDFEFDVYLTVNGRRQSDYGMYFTGTFGNEVMELYGDSGSVDISDGCVAQAMEYISKLEVNIGSGVTVQTRLSKDKKIYGTATRTPDRTDDEMMKEHKEISDVITLSTIGLNHSGSIVKLGPEFRGYHVYGKDLEYLGKGGDDLPYADKYYLSSKKLEIPEEEEKESESSKAPVKPEKPVKDVSEPTVPSVTETTSVNVNHNPGTGR